MATTFDINQFRTKLKNGGARPNQFEVQITFPPAITNLNAAYGRASSFLVTVAELPGQTIGVAPVYYRGRLIKMAGDREFAPFQCTVLNDSGFTIRSAIEQWMNGMENLGNKTGALQPAQYQTDMFISQLDRNGSVLKQYKLIGAFPVELGAVGLDFGSNDQLSTFSVSFQYQTFEFSNNPAQQLVDAITTLA